MATYDHGQAQIISDLRAAARQRYSDPHERAVKLKAALETGLVESNFKNLSGGDADSEGWRQERASLYKNPTDVHASIGRFFDEADQQWNGKMDSGALAAAVQRPAASARGLYGLAGPKVQGLLGGTTGSTSAPATATAATAPTVTPASTTTDDKGAMVDALMNNHGDLLGRYLQLRATGNYTTTTPAKTTAAPATATAAEATTADSSTVDAIKAAAQHINDKKLPYKWGGGHGDNSGLYDCSGFVSKVEGINPRVASQFEKWGEAGKGKRITIYAKDDHVIMEIDGHFVGTSHSNPGGGPGWIPRKDISAAYLAQFTARHAPGQ